MKKTQVFSFLFFFNTDVEQFFSTVLIKEYCIKKKKDLYVRLLLQQKRIMRDKISFSKETYEEITSIFTGKEIRFTCVCKIICNSPM